MKKLNEINLLIIDDNEAVLNAFVKALNKMYKNVYAVHNGIEALEALNEDANIDLIITDLDMSGMNGFELIEKLNLMGNKIPIVVLTGYTKINVEEKLEQLKIECSFVKPVSIATLNDVILKLVNQSPS